MGLHCSLEDIDTPNASTVDVYVCQLFEVLTCAQDRCSFCSSICLSRLAITSLGSALNDDIGGLFLGFVGVASVAETALPLGHITGQKVLEKYLLMHKLRYNIEP